MSGNIDPTAPQHSGSTAYINARIVDPTGDAERPELLVQTQHGGTRCPAALGRPEPQEVLKPALDGGAGDPYADETGRFFHWKTPKQKAIEQREHHRVGPDADGQAQHHHRHEPRLAAERSHRGLDISSHGLIHSTQTVHAEFR